MITTEISKGYYIIKASSVSDVIDVKPSAANLNHRFFRWPQNQLGAPSESWLGVSGGAPALQRIVARGWPEGRRRAEESITRVEVPRIRSVKRQRVRSDAGDHLDMQRVYSGDLDTAWETTRRDVGVSFKSPLVSLVVNIGANARVSAESLFWRGAAALVACDALESSGRRVEIIAYCSTMYCYENTGSHQCPHGIEIVRVKAHEDAVNLDALASVLALAGFFRYYTFMMELSAPFRVSPGFGSADQRVPTAEQLGISPNSEVIHLSNIWTREETQEFVSSLVGTTLT